MQTDLVVGDEEFAGSNISGLSIEAFDERSSGQFLSRSKLLALPLMVTAAYGYAPASFSHGSFEAIYKFVDSTSVTRRRSATHGVAEMAILYSFGKSILGDMQELDQEFAVLLNEFAAELR